LRHLQPPRDASNMRREGGVTSRLPAWPSIGRAWAIASRSRSASTRRSSRRSSKGSTPSAPLFPTSVRRGRRREGRARCRVCGLARACDPRVQRGAVGRASWACNNDGVTRSGQPPHPTGWDTDGIEGEHRFVTLLYNEPADVLIAQFERKVAGGRYPVRSIYMKRREEPRYAKVFGTDDLSSAFYIVAASKKPVAFFDVHVASVDRWRADTPGMGFDWSHIAQIDLRTGSVTTVVDAAAFRERHEGAWVSDLASADEDGQAVLCRIGGLPHQAPTGAVGYSPARDAGDPVRPARGRSMVRASSGHAGPVRPRTIPPPHEDDRTPGHPRQGVPDDRDHAELEHDRSDPRGLERPMTWACRPNRTAGHLSVEHVHAPSLRSQDHQAPAISTKASTASGTSSSPG
jgi:hypothetical protein